MLFQHIASLANLDRINDKTFSIAELRAVLGVAEGKLARFANLKAWALTPAVEEINQLSRLTLTATPRKIGRTVVSVNIAWELKDDPSAAKRELDRPKAGRKARREGSVEKVAATFPASGGIEFDKHWVSLKRAAGCNMDNTMIAEKFRAWCSGKGVALNAHNIEQTFSNFCAKVGKV